MACPYKVNLPYSRLSPRGISKKKQRNLKGKPSSFIILEPNIET